MVCKRSVSAGMSRWHCHRFTCVLSSEKGTAAAWHERDPAVSIKSQRFFHIGERNRRDSGREPQW